jgi:hypothetical protein
MIRPALLLVLGLAACPVSPDQPGNGGDARLEFAAQVVRPGNPVQPGVSAEGGAGSVVVRGQLDAPDPCQKVSGKLESSGSELTLRVEVTSSPGACIAVIGNFTYAATVSGLTPGAYRLRVVHTYPGTGWETKTALEQSVQVR